jgi:2-C-methyl-D-erythritol 4-phosphate cytidylyltransferase
MGFDKIWAGLANRVVLSYALVTLAASEAVDRIALVVAAERAADARALAAGLDRPVNVCEGGALRRDSVAAGAGALPDCEWLIVHDAARPFLTDDLIRRGLTAARPSGAAVAAVPVRDTIKRVDRDRVIATLPRDELWSVQTPQVFRADLLRAALRSSDEDVTDEATLVERMGGEVRIYLGSDRNVKITTPGDLELAEAWLSGRRAVAEPG